MIIYLTVILLSSCNQSKTDKIDNTVLIKKVEIHKDTTSFVAMSNQYDNWLNEITLEKPKKGYISIIENIYKNLPIDSCAESTKETLLNKDGFQKLIKEFKIYSLNNKYLIVRGYNYYSSSVGCIYSLFMRNTGSRIKFKK